MTDENETQVTLGGGEDFADDVMVGEDEQMVDAEVKKPRVRRTFADHVNVTDGDVARAAATEMMQAVLDGSVGRIDVRGRRAAKDGGDYRIGIVTKAPVKKASTEEGEETETQDDDAQFRVVLAKSPLQGERQSELRTFEAGLNEVVAAVMAHNDATDVIRYTGKDTRTYMVAHVPTVRKSKKQKTEEGQAADAAVETEESEADSAE